MSEVVTSPAMLARDPELLAACVRIVQDVVRHRLYYFEVVPGMAQPLHVKDDAAALRALETSRYLELNCRKIVRLEGGVETVLFEA